ncbi:MAG: hypothetical protein ACKVZH_16610 [Blastocatellia bacterium]
MNLIVESQRAAGHEIELPPATTAAEFIGGFQFKLATTARLAAVAFVLFGLTEQVDDFSGVHCLLLQKYVGQILNLPPQVTGRARLGTRPTLFQSRSSETTIING